MKPALGALALAFVPLLSQAAPGQGHMDHTNMAGMNHASADIGQAARNPTRTIQVDMGDNMRFTPGPHHRQTGRDRTPGGKEQRPDPP